MPRTPRPVEGRLFQHAPSSPQASVPLRPDLTPEQQMRRLLSEASLHLSTSGLGIHAYSVIAPPGHPLHGQRLGIDTVAQVMSLIEEVPAHLACPNVWNAVTEAKPAGGVAWAAGYMAVRSLLLPRQGSFRSHSDLSVYKVPCPYEEEAQREAFFSGCRYYLRAFSQALRTHRQQQTQREHHPVQATGTDPE